MIESDDDLPLDASTDGLDRYKQIEPNIWIDELEGKWYFNDETSAFIGPYSSKKEAKEELERYCKEYL